MKSKAIRTQLETHWCQLWVSRSWLKTAFFERSPCLSGRAPIFGTSEQKYFWLQLLTMSKDDLQKGIRSIEVFTTALHELQEWQELVTMYTYVQILVFDTYGTRPGQWGVLWN